MLRYLYTSKFRVFLIALCILALSASLWWALGKSGHYTELRSQVVLELTTERVAQLLQTEQGFAGENAEQVLALLSQVRSTINDTATQALLLRSTSSTRLNLSTHIAALENAVTAREPEQIHAAFRLFRQASMQHQDGVLRTFEIRRMWVSGSFFLALLLLLLWGYRQQLTAQRDRARIVKKAQSFLTSMLDGALVLDQEGIVVAQNGQITHRKLLPGICIGSNLINFLAPMLSTRALEAFKDDLFALFEASSHDELGSRLRSEVVELNATSLKKSTQCLEFKLSKCQWVNNQGTDDLFVLLVVANMSEHVETQRTLEAAMRLQKSRPNHVVKALYSVPSEVRRYLARSKMTEHDIRHALNAHENNPAVAGDTLRTVNQLAKAMLTEAKAIHLELFVEAWAIFIEIYAAQQVKKLLEERVLMRLQAKLDDIHMLRKSLEALMPMMVAAHSYREQYGHDSPIGDFAAIEQMSHDLIDAHASFSESFSIEEALTQTVNRKARAKAQAQVERPEQGLRNYLTAVSERVAAREGKKIEIFFKGLDKVDTQHPYFDLLSKVGEELLSNSIEHGLEIELDRILTHKERLGRIDVEFTESNEIACLSVRDDGKGLDFTQIRTTAIERGLIEQNHAELNRGDLLRYIFAEGFYTEPDQDARDRPDKDAKGTGLSQVKTLLKASGGKVSVRSVDGQYCQFKVKLPVKT